MTIRYRHTSITARNWQLLARFYESVFACEIVPPQRDLAGDALACGTGVDRAELAGVHLKLPGFGADGPTLEIYQYGEVIDPGPGPANTRGYTHLAFEVDDVEAVYAEALEHGGRKIADITSFPVPGAGTVTFVYVEDPEGNIIEIQKWD